MCIDSMRRSVAVALLMAAAQLLHGCATTAPPEPTPAGPAPAKRHGPAAAPRANALTIERQWLQSWFDGTPVRIVQHEAQAMTVDVPLEFCFDAGQSKPKPPLVAVLDKVAESLLRRPMLRLDRVAAPDDGGKNSPLAHKRAKRVRGHLLARGVPAWQVAAPSMTTAAAVQLRIDGAVH